MLLDYHFHLEEGPYSISWLERTARAIANIERNQNETASYPNTIDWISELTKKLENRISQGCFTEEWLEHYLTIGKQRGIQRFGVVDHLYRFREFKPYYEKHMLLDDTPLGQLQQTWLDKVCTASFEEFETMVKKMKERHEHLAIGIESDYFIGGEKELQNILSTLDLDYIIGSVHFIDGWGFDNPETKEKYEEFHLEEAYAHFFQTVKKAIESKLFDFVAHLDNFKVFNYRPDEQILLPHYEMIAKTLQRENMATEINTGLSYRYPIKEMCPSPSFLQQLHQYHVPITLSSDAHFPDDIGTNIEQALQLAKQTGYDELVYFKNRQRYTVSI